jgi:hypothetical protein
MSKIREITMGDKNTIYLFAVDQQAQALGWVECYSATEWSAYNVDGKFINWFTSKKHAIAAVIA